MAMFATLPLTTVPENAVMATGIFKMGNQASYARLLFPVQVGVDQAGLRDLVLSDIVAAFEAMDSAAESKLMSITISLKHDPDDAAIPAADPESENSLYALLRTAPRGNGEGPGTFQVRVPNVPATFNAGDWIETNKGKFFDPATGLCGVRVVSLNLKPDRIARMTV